MKLKIQVFKTLIMLAFLLPISSFAQDSSETDAQPLPSKEELLALQPNDHYIGNKEAPVLMIEYSSLTCPYCAEFHKNILRKIKENYMDKGTVLYTHRNFPTNKPSLTAASLAVCSGKYFRFLDALFESQNMWAFHKNYEKSLLNIAKLSGMDNAEFKKCIENEDISGKILSSTLAAARVLEVNATPTLLINGKILEHHYLSSYKKISDFIDKELSAAPKNSNIQGIDTEH